MIVKLLSYGLEILPYLAFGSRRHILDGAEIGLKLLKFLKFNVYSVDVRRYGVHLLQQLELLLQIGLAARLVGGYVFLTFLLECSVERVEFILQLIGLGCKRRRFVAGLYKRVQLLQSLAAAQTEKGLLHRRHFPMAFHLVILQNLLHRGHEFFLAHRVYVAGRSLLCLCYTCAFSGLAGRCLDFRSLDFRSLYIRHFHFRYLLFKFVHCLFVLDPSDSLLIGIRTEFHISL